MVFSSLPGSIRIRVEHNVIKTAAEGYVEEQVVITTDEIDCDIVPVATGDQVKLCRLEDDDSVGLELLF